MIKFLCPKCDIRISAEPADAGATVNCPSCGNALVVPAETLSPQGSTRPSEDPSIVSENILDPECPIDDSAEHQLDTGEVGSHLAANPDEIVTLGEASPMHKFGTTLASFAKSAAHEVKLNSQIAVLKTRIENAKQIELRKAHYVLGRKLYDARILLSMQNEIEALEHQLAEKGERAVIDENETKAAMIKRVGTNAAKSAESELLSIKLKQSLTHLGELARNLPEANSLPDINAEMNAVYAVESKIQKLEGEHQSLGALSKASNFLNENPKNMRRWMTLGAGSAVILAIVFLSLFYFSDSNSSGDSKSEVARSMDSEKILNVGRPYAIAEAKDFNYREAASNSKERSKISFPNKGTIIVKGFYVGMSEQAAISQLKNIFGNDLKIDKKEKLYRGLEVYFFASPSIPLLYDWCEEKSGCLIDIDPKTRTLSAFSISGAHLYKMFEINNLSFEEFAQQFMSQFSIPTLQPLPNENNEQFLTYSYIDQMTNIRLIKRVREKGWISFSMDLIDKATF